MDNNELRKNMMEISDDELDMVAGGAGCGGSGSGKKSGSSSSGGGKGKGKGGSGSSSGGQKWTCPFCSKTFTLKNCEESSSHMANCPKNPYI